MVYPLQEPYAEFLRSGKSTLERSDDSPGRWTHVEFWSAEDHGAWQRATMDLSREQTAINHALHVVAVERGSFFYGWIPLVLSCGGFILLVLMARPLGRVRVGVALLFMMALATSVTAWVRSSGHYWARDAIMHGTSVAGLTSHHVSLSILRGKLLFDSGDSWTDVGDSRVGWLFGKRAELTDTDLPPTIAGFGFQRYHISRGFAGRDGTCLAVPLWAVILLCAAYPVFFAVSWWRRLHRARNPYACPNCGYDLRASARCPECGHIVSSSTA
ncbi:MAG TPA: zinc ribbon domain-containing protein [Phycisphaerae bacterium]|nr:zinc ribbon domain-containing protein [Phycisphaerae bacterium]